MDLIPPIADLQKIATLGLGQRSHRPIVDDEQIDSVEPVEQLTMAAIGPRLSEVAKQFRGFEEERGVTVAAGLLRQRARQPSFAHAGRSNQEQVLVFPYP